MAGNDFWSTNGNLEGQSELEKKLQREDTTLESVFEDESITDNLLMQNDKLVD